MGDDTIKATKNICCAKGEGEGEVTRWIKKFCLACKNINYQIKLGRPKTIESDAVLWR